MSFLDTSQPIFIKRDGPIGYLVLNRPDKKNAMSEAMWRTIPEALAALDGDRNIRAIILTSSSKGVFSAGADIGELAVIAESAERQESNRKAIREAQRALCRAEKPTIAMIDGPCIGGGCGLAIHCDMRFASNTACFGITPAKLGIVYPLNDTKQLIDLIGPSHAKSLLFTGRIIKVGEALAMGLIDTQFEEEELTECTHAFALDISKVSQYSVRQMKKIIQRVLEGQFDDDDETARIFKKAQEGEDAQEGIQAFLEKRSPRFTWDGEN